MVTYFTDTDTDMTLETANKYGYKLISMPYSVNDEFVYPYQDFEVFDSKTYYEMLRAGTIPKTSGLSKETYIEYFEPEFKKGNDVFYIHFSAKMSSTFDFMELALRELKEKYPERKFYELDTKGISINSLFTLMVLGDMILEGKSPDEILSYGKELIEHVATYFYADDLKFFKRTGRVSGIYAVMGTMLGIKPIIVMNDEGIMKNIGKERGKKSAISAILKVVAEIGEDIKKYPILIANSDCMDDALYVEAQLKAKFGDDLVVSHIDINPTAGAHCGPSCIGVCFHAKHR